MNNSVVISKLIEIFEILLLVYAIVILPVTYSAFIWFSASYGVPFSEISNTLGIVVPSVVATALLIMLIASAYLCIPAFLTTPIIPKVGHVMWQRPLSYLQWIKAEQEVNWGRLYRSTLPGIYLFQLILLFNMLGPSPITSETVAVQLGIVVLLFFLNVVLLIEGRPRFYVFSNFIIMVHYGFLSLLIVRLIPRVHWLSWLDYINSEAIAFLLFQIGISSITSLLVLVPVISKRPSSALLMVIAGVFMLAFLWPRLPHFINQVFLITRIGGSAQAMLQIRSEVGCRLPLLDPRPEACAKPHPPSYVEARAWLSFQSQDRLYLRLRKPTDDDRKAMIVLNREDVGSIRYIEIPVTGEELTAESSSPRP